jgi:ribosome biogenesis GTPase
MSAPRDHLADLGWTTELAGSFAGYVSAHRPARVCRLDRGAALVADAEDMAKVTFGGELLAAVARDRTSLPAVGDWVALRDWPDERTTLEAVLPRRSAFVREGAGRTSHGQVLAANLDVVVIVEHLDPEPDVGRVERLLVLAWASGALPVVVLTKADLVPDPVGMRDEVAAVAPGVEVMAGSAATGQGLDRLRAHLGPGRTLALLGPSGAGKSTLTNLLAGAEIMKTDAVRSVDGKGRHTTTHRELVVLPGVGVVIDTPGLRAVGLVAGADALAQAFAEIEALASHCRFSDCRHDQEPGCAVRAAVDAGDLDELRVARWRKLGREAAAQARRAEARLHAHRDARRHRRRKNP